MRTRLTYAIPMLAAATLTSVGCQNTLTISVQMVTGVKKAQLQRDSRYGHQVLATIGSLAHLKKQSDDYKGQLAEFKSSTDVEFRNAEQLLAQLSSDIKDKVDEIDKLRKELNDFFKLSDATGQAPRIAWTLLRARQLADDHRRWWNELIADIKSLDSVAIEKVKPLLKIAAVAKNAALDLNATAKRGGFGGFQTVGIFEINPSDPAYQEVFKPGLSRASISWRTLTQATAMAVGDSSLMLVMESPGQVRTHQVSNDPTQLLRNVALIIGKATGAASKFLSGGLAP